MRIAICDDDAQTLELMQSYVSRYAESRSKTLHAECFQTPDKLLALLQQNEYNNFDVIFIDISMPGRSGIEVILYIESLGKKAVIKTFGGDYPTYISQKSLIANLPKSFIQCHKSYIINMQMVKKRNAANCMLVNDSVIPIGRKYMHVFKDAYFRYLLDSGRNL